MDVAKVKRAQAIARGWLARKAFARRKKRARHRTHVCKELLDTEQTYVRSLKTLQQAYLDPLRRINPELASSIASNLQQIIELHSMLLGQLEARISAWTYHSRIADIFMQVCFYPSPDHHVVVTFLTTLWNRPAHRLSQKPTKKKKLIFV
jgi:hypothetical protein